jgi:predicted secreted protein
MRIVHILLIWLCAGAYAAADGTPPAYDRITLSVTAEQRVANDTLVADMYSEREGDRAADVANEVNENVSWALGEANAVEGLSVQTTGYHSQPVYRDRTVIGWRVRQSIRLESKDTAGLSELIGRLQSRLAMSSIGYRISPDRRAAAEDELIKRALASFDTRARLIAGQLGRPGFRIVRLDVVTSDSPVRPMAMQRMAAAMESGPAGGVAPPALESGEQNVQVRVNGTIELKLN